MKQGVSIFLLLLFLLTACSAVITTPLVPTETPRPLESLSTKTLTPIPSKTPTETLTPVPSETPTETPIPSLESQPTTQESVTQFASAMQKAGINITAEQILKQGLQIQTFAGIGGKQYEIATTHLGPDPNQKEEALAGDYPLMIKMERGWVKVGLKDVIKIPIGAHIQSDRFNGKLQEIIVDDFSGAFFGWDVQWKAVEPTEGQVSFSQQWVHADKLKQFADTNRVSVIGNNIFWPALYPDWLTTNPHSKEQIRAIMQRRISYLKDYFGGTVGTWVVVNEYAPLSFINGGAPDDVLLRTMGEGYVDLAFQMARDTFPRGTKLISNHGLNETRDSVFYPIVKPMVDRLKNENVIDGVGLQMHIDGSKPPGKDELIATMRSYGLPIYITEFDVNMGWVKGTQEERLRKQADIYRTIVEACLESGACVSLYFFDVGDSNSWYEAPGSTWMASPNADATLFDDNLNPKISYYSVLKTLFDGSK